MHKPSKKAKQRLVMKASKLRAEDLERIAVLKRCGLFVSEHAGNPNADVSAGCEQEPTARAAHGKVQRKMADIMSQTDGSAGLLHVLQRQYTAPAGTGRCESPIAGSVVHVPAHVPTGTPLGIHRKGHSSTHLNMSVETDGQEDDMSNCKDPE